MNNTIKQKQQNNYELFYNTIKALSYSQGSYGRLLRDVDSLSKEDKQKLVDELPAFKDCVDVVLWIE